MAATSNIVTEFAAGCEPERMSRSTTSTRLGFSAFCFLPSIVANSLLTNACCGQIVEARGCRAQILMSAKTAMEM
jgi:hypothetical protein